MLFRSTHGPERYRERLRHSRPYLEYLLDKAAAGLDFGHGEGRREFLHQMLEIAARIPDAAVRDQFADRIAHKAQVTEEVVRAEIRKAAAHGDLRENFEYKAAREKQEMLSSRAKNLHDELRRARALDAGGIDASAIRVGTRR